MQASVHAGKCAATERTRGACDVCTHSPGGLRAAAGSGAGRSAAEGRGYLPSEGVLSRAKPTPLSWEPSHSPSQRHRPCVVATWCTGRAVAAGSGLGLHDAPFTIPAKKIGGVSHIFRYIPRYSSFPV